MNCHKCYMQFPFNIYKEKVRCPSCGHMHHLKTKTHANGRMTTTISSRSKERK